MATVTSLDLFTVHSQFRVSLRVITYSKTITSKGVYESHCAVIQKAKNGDMYVRFTPSPFIVIDVAKRLSTKSTSTKDTTKSLNRRDTYIFIKILENIIHDFVTISDLFVVIHNQTTSSIQFNTKYSDKEYSISLKGGTELIKLKPAVVQAYDERNNKNGMYEGVDVYFNDLPVSYLTIGDIHYLHNELCKLDMMGLSMKMMDMTIQYVNSSESGINYKECDESNNRSTTLDSEKPEPELIDIKYQVKPDTNVIPDLT